MLSSITDNLLCFNYHMSLFTKDNSPYIEFLSEYFAEPKTVLRELGEEGE